MTTMPRATVLAVAAGAALAVAPMAVTTVATPAVSRAACDTSQAGGADCVPQCPDLQLRDNKSGDCVDLLSAISSALPPAPQLPAVPDLSGLPNVSVPSIGLPSIGLPLPTMGLPSAPQGPQLCGPEIKPFPPVDFTPCI